MIREQRDTFLPFSRPSIDEDEIAEVVDTLRSGWVTTGPKVQRFEREFSEYVGASHALAVNSCTAGLEIALDALGVGAGDEVILPTLTFCSTANVVVHRGARPVLVDVGPDLNVSVQSIEAAIGPRTRAIVPVHYAGQPCDLEAIYALAARRGLAVVEDAAHAVGATYHGHQIGSDALAAALHAHAVPWATVFSFYATKNMTTGEGGMIATRDAALADRMRVLTLHGMSRDAWNRYSKGGSWQYEVVEAGYKANMTDVQAALGIHQLRKLGGFLEARRAIVRYYDQELGSLPGIRRPARHDDRTHTFHLYPVVLDLERLTIDRAEFIEELRARNIGSSVHFIPVHLQPFYRERFGYAAGDLPSAEGAFTGLVSLPIFPGMSEDDASDVAQTVALILRAHSK